MNLYGYVGNSVMNEIDPFGLLGIGDGVPTGDPDCFLRRLLGCPCEGNAKSGGMEIVPPPESRINSPSQTPRPGKINNIPIRKDGSRSPKGNFRFPPITAPLPSPKDVLVLPRDTSPSGPIDKAAELFKRFENKSPFDVGVGAGGTRTYRDSQGKETEFPNPGVHIGVKAKW